MRPRGRPDLRAREDLLLHAFATGELSSGVSAWLIWHLWRYGAAWRWN